MVTLDERYGMTSWMGHAIILANSLSRAELKVTRYLQALQIRFREQESPQRSFINKKISEIYCNKYEFLADKG